MDHAAIYLEAAELYPLDTARGRYYSSCESDFYLCDLTRLVKEDVVKARVSANVALVLHGFEERKKSGDLRAVNQNYRKIQLTRQANGQKIHSYRGYINTLIREALIHHARVHREDLVKITGA
jgi:hypothetical protein